MKGNRSLRRAERLKGRLAFEIIKRRSRPIRGECLIVNIYPNNLSFNRIGISISSRIVHGSVKRNRLKRLIREAYRLHKEELEEGFDIVVRARPVRRSPGFRVIEKDLLAILKKKGILR